ncbi:hypothetical protein EHQ53_12640 [Leptospira langatensis]|uniref:Membrane-binding protein n=2 Tax=Leptospira langatensis TaxID=2484983 RepID=A0A5F1ZT58_9LEPT|nr:hypothetical protein [Leptospira langatensis]TGK02769.1 hypothetical protein EHO57_05470 [Leptospira langatensis]TGL40026.1 hypothetical protein EHQ53_12640 [Leptospira langatensis]
MNRSYYPMLLLPVIVFGAYYYFSARCLEGNCREGYGIRSLPGSYRYEGNFENGLAHGKGKLLLESGESYDGTWVKGNKEGTGINLYPDGSSYEGTWKANKRDGKGILKASDGSIIFKGKWKADKEVYE